MAYLLRYIDPYPDMCHENVCDTKEDAFYALANSILADYECQGSDLHDVYSNTAQVAAAIRKMDCDKLLDEINKGYSGGMYYELRPYTKPKKRPKKDPMGVILLQLKDLNI